MKLRDLLELCRVSNLPTVWSNVAMGVVWGEVLIRPTLEQNGHLIMHERFSLPEVLYTALGLLIGASLAYSGGMILNDAFDAKIDAKERPSRPIPSGRVSRNHALLVGFAMLLGAAYFFLEGLIVWVMACGLSLIVCIVLYNAVHSRFSGSVVIMALCRALLVFAAVMLWTNNYGPTPAMLIAPAALFAYTLAISIVARHEVPAGRAWVVGMMITCMPLVDAALLLSIQQWQIVPFCVGCAVLTWVGQRFVAGS